MLSSTEILKSLSKGCSKRYRLAVVPAPDANEICKRSAASLDLRLGRWFRSFKQTANAEIPLFRNDSSVGRNNDRGVDEAITRDDDVFEERISRTRQHFVRFGKPFILHPGSFVLGATLEWLRLPRGLSAYVTGKSSLGRHGLVIETASGIHPGFSGCLTLELANVGEVPLTLTPGMKICQVFFHKVEPSKDLDRGSLSGSRKPTVPSIDTDPVLKKLLKKALD